MRTVSRVGWVFVAMLASLGCGGSGDSAAPDDAGGDAAPDDAIGLDGSDVGAPDASTDGTPDAPADVTDSADAAPGKPFLDFFPIGVWLQPTRDFSKWKSRGINTLVGAESEGGAVSVEAWSAAAEAAGLHMIRKPLTKASDDVGKSLLLAWGQLDEPDTKTASFSPAMAKAQYDEWKKLDPSRAVYENFSGGEVWYTNGSFGECDGPGDGTKTSDCYPAFIEAGDWISNDYYPTAGWDPPQDPAMVGKVIDKLTKWSKGKPQFAYVETCYQGLPWAPKAGFPSRDQFRGEIWDAIVHGVRGLVYFADRLGGGSTGVGFTWDNTPADVADEMVKQDALIASLASVLQGPIDPAPFSASAPAPLELAWRSDGTRVYFLVLNMSATPQKGAALKLEGVSGKSLTERISGRAITATAGAFTDDFGAYELHVYVAS